VLTDKEKSLLASIEVLNAQKQRLEQEIRQLRIEKKVAASGWDASSTVSTGNDSTIMFDQGGFFYPGETLKQSLEKTNK
jgi:hypothetical protein